MNIKPCSDRMIEQNLVLKYPRVNIEVSDSHCLRKHEDLSAIVDDSEENRNMIIQGDNLVALPLLQDLGVQVNCIFIDPPYNTKGIFAQYNDNLEHSLWLSAMDQRLRLLRELLHDSGTIWVTMDDNEGHYLRVLLDEIFGEDQCISHLIWETRGGKNSRCTYYARNHNHIFAYAKDATRWKERRSKLSGTLQSIIPNKGNCSTDIAQSEIKEAVKGAFDTAKPENLIKKILHYCTQEQDLVLDAFLGSGTTAVVAHKEKRAYIGIEKCEKNTKQFCVKRLKHTMNRRKQWGCVGFTYFSVEKKSLGQI